MHQIHNKSKIIPNSLTHKKFKCDSFSDGYYIAVAVAVRRYNRVLYALIRSPLEINESLIYGTMAHVYHCRYAYIFIYSIPLTSYAVSHFSYFIHSRLELLLCCFVICCYIKLKAL